MWGVCNDSVIPQILARAENSEHYFHPSWISVVLFLVVLNIRCPWERGLLWPVSITERMRSV